MDDRSDRFTFLGRDLQTIPCFKQSFTYGILSGIAVGLGHFLFTSRAKRSGDLGMAFFAVVTISTWVSCRYRWSKSRTESRRLQEAMQKSLSESDRGGNSLPTDEA